METCMWSSLWQQQSDQEASVVVKDISGLEDDEGFTQRNQFSPSEDDEDDEEQQVEDTSDDSEQQNADLDDEMHPAIELAVTKSSERFARTRRRTLIWMALCISVAVVLLGVVTSVLSRRQNQRTVSAVVVVENSHNDNNDDDDDDDSASLSSSSPAPTNTMGMKSSVAVLPTPTIAPAATTPQRVKGKQPKETATPSDAPSDFPSLPPTIFPTKTPSVAPSTLTPSTLAPTTLGPTTLGPTTLEPTTLAPTTLAPTTLTPTTLAPTTRVPSFLAVAAPLASTTTITPTVSSDLKSSWPELVGMDATKAAWIILEDRPDIETIVFVLFISNDPQQPDRVRIVRDPVDNTVAETPRVG